MAYRTGHREQLNLFPASIEDYVKDDDVVRVYDTFVDSLNLDNLGLVIDFSKVGNPAYEPESMLKLLLYGYSYGLRSSRQLERALYHNISFIWLMGGLKPDHKTISNFRKQNKSVLKQVFKQCAKLCIKLNLIEGNTLFLDGSKIRANASMDNSITEKKGEKLLKKIEIRIDEILQECEQIDESEEGQKSFVKLQKELNNKNKIKEKIAKVLETIKSEERTELNTTDKDAMLMKSRQGTHAAYNSQIVVDEKNSLIVSCDVVSDQTDQRQFANQINKANEILKNNCKIACADQGYSKTDKLEEIDNKKITVVVPIHETSANNVADKSFSKDKFKYIEEEDCYRCPEGNKLIYSSTYQGFREYRIESAKLCLNCPHLEKCTRSKQGRRILRLINEQVKEKIKLQNQTTEIKEIFNLRKQKVEHPFGYIKRNMNVSSFLMRGLEGVRAEMAIFCTCFNLRRMMTIVGKENLVRDLAA